MNTYSKIYLVDDFEMVNVLHGILFKKLGMDNEVKAYTDPEKALEDIAKDSVQHNSILILLDINMPEMSGFDFLDVLKRKSFKMYIDVVIVTSSISESDKARAKTYPMLVKDYVIKPLKQESLKQLIERPKRPDILIS